MKQQLNAFAKTPTLAAAQRVVKYEAKHPFAVCGISPEQSALLASAKQLVSDVLFWGSEEALAGHIDALISRNTGFTDMADLLDAKGDYRPSLDCRAPANEAIACAYDREQMKRGSDKRAYRYGEV
mgnify:CR=1 FL=1